MGRALGLLTALCPVGVHSTVPPPRALCPVSPALPPGQLPSPDPRLKDSGPLDNGPARDAFCVRSASVRPSVSKERNI